MWDSIGGIYSNIMAPCVTNQITELKVYNGILYAGGSFSDTIGNPTVGNAGVAGWNSLKWSFYGYYQTTALNTYKNTLFAGATGIDQFTGSTWVSVGNGISCCSSTNCACAAFSILSDVFAIAGYNGKLYAGGDFLASYGNQASYFLEYSGVVGINELKENYSIKVFPNPSKGVFTFQLSGINQQSRVEIYNMIGEKVYSQPLPIVNSQFSINLSNQASGIYLYRLIDNNGKAIGSGKLIIEKP